MTDLSTQSPSEIDTQLAALYQAEQVALSRLESVRVSIHYKAGSKKFYLARGTSWSQSFKDALDKVSEMATDESLVGYKRAEAQKVLVDYEAAEEKVSSIIAQAEVFNAEFTRRGGWTRAFLATSSTSPHVHNGMDCSTCNKMGKATEFGWFPEYSGKPESEIVEDAGERACTTCYPTAPVATLSRPTKFFSEAEKTKAQARIEREQAKADRLAKKIANGLTADGSEFVVNYVEHNQGGHERDPLTGQSTYVYKDRPRREFFKTEGAALQWVVRYAIWEKGLHAGDKAPAFAQVIEAVATKHGKTIEQVTAEVEAKIAAKNKRDNR